MTRVWAWVTLGAVVLALGGLGYWFAQHLVPERRPVAVGFSGPARSNDFYAAERLLERLGVSAESVAHLDSTRFLGPDDTLILTTPGFALAEAQRRGLLNWVSAGGHLLFAPQVRPNAPSDPLLQALGLAVTYGRTIAESSTVTLGDRSFAVEVATGRLLAERRPAPKGQLSNPSEGLLVRQFSRGRGQITVAAELDWFHNDRLSRGDHGALLWALIHGGNPDAKVWLQYWPQMPSFAWLLLHHAWMPLVGLGLTLVALLWWVSARFGPLRVEHPREQRSLVAHLRASGHFLWRHQPTALLAAARSRTLATVGLRGPMPADTLAALAAHRHLETRALSRALCGDNAVESGDEGRFISNLQTLQSLQPALPAARTRSHPGGDPAG